MTIHWNHADHIFQVHLLLMTRAHKGKPPNNVSLIN